MKPLSLCLVQMGQKGLELVKAHPDVLPLNVINEIVIKSMPMSAKDGDFTSSTVADTVFSGYVFSVPSDTGRDNIASLVAVFNDMKYNSEIIQKIFSFTVSELKKNNLADINTITKILPNLYTGLADGQLKVKISSIVTLEFDIKDKKDNDLDQEAIDGFGKDLWK